MKIEPRRIDSFLRDPGVMRIVLLYGDDRALISDRAISLIRCVAGSVDDPFRVVSLSREHARALPNELSGLSLTGGRRVVHVHDASDALAEPVRLALAGPGTALGILEAGALPPRSKLRALIEESRECAAIACYPDDASTLRGLLEGELSRRGATAEEDALAWLASRLSDRAAVRQEAEKLSLYVGSAGRVDIETATECVADQGAQSLDDALFCATGGDIHGADRALGRAISEGSAPVQIVRAVTMHLQRLHQAKLATMSGTPPAEAAKRLRPPIFFKRLPVFSRAVTDWPEAELRIATHRSQQTERACKRTGAPAEELTRGLILALAGRGLSFRRR